MEKQLNEYLKVLTAKEKNYLRDKLKPQQFVIKVDGKTLTSIAHELDINNG